MRFSEQTRFPIGVDESFRDSPYNQIPTLKAVIIKPTLTGFIPNIDKNISLVLSSSYESSLGILNIARLAPDGINHGLDTFKNDLLLSPLYVEDGKLCWSPKKEIINFSKLCLIATAP